MSLAVQMARRTGARDGEGRRQVAPHAAWRGEPGKNEENFISRKIRSDLEEHCVPAKKGGRNEEIVDALPQ